MRDDFESEFERLRGVAAPATSNRTTARGYGPLSSWRGGRASATLPWRSGANHLLGMRSGRRPVGWWLRLYIQSHLVSAGLD